MISSSHICRLAIWGIAFLSVSLSPPVLAKNFRTGAELLQALRVISDHGGIDDVPYIERTLGLQLQRQPDMIRMESCKSNTVTRRSMATQYTTADDALLPTENGINIVETQEFTVNPSAIIKGPTVLTLTTTNEERCKGEWFVLNDTQLIIEVNSLFAFDCMRSYDVLAALPGSEFVLATDGASHVTYSPLSKRDYGARLQVSFFAGTQCALDAKLVISSSEGLRERAAMQQDFWCLWRARLNFCESHPQATASDILMETAIRRQCGAVELRFRKTPRNARPIENLTSLDLRRDEPLCVAAKRFVSRLPR